jgi:His/Glu/Gln/Arg/opine family amino acid ABC transporter permease subunit
VRVFFDKIAAALSMDPGFVQALRVYADRLPGAALVSLEVTAGALVVSFMLGMSLALFRRSANVGLSTAAAGIITASRCLPLPPLQFVIYFGILYFARIDGRLAGILAIGLFSAGYMAELFRSGINSVPLGQIEAARALGMSEGSVRRRLIIPVAIRIMLPAIGQLTVGMLLQSAFVSQIGVRDITGMARNIINDTFIMQLWVVLALTYFCVAFPISRALGLLERWLTADD